jgi:uncharacterized Zn-finger protein
VVGSLKRHIQAVHKNFKPFQCEICKASFAFKSYLKNHVSGVHGNLKPFQCLICKSSFSQAGSLKRHESTVHKNVQFENRCFHSVVLLTDILKLSTSLT